jgi:hypothetical protein
MSSINWSWGEWHQLYPGVEWAVGYNPAIPFSADAIPFPPNVPHSGNVNILRIDLGNPKISFLSTPGHDLNKDGVTVPRFLQIAYNNPQLAAKAMVATNANYFDNRTDVKNTIYGLAVSQGQTVPWQPFQPVNNVYPPYCPLLITKDNQAVIGGANSPRNPDTYTAVSGDLLILQNGQIAVDPPGPNTTTPIVAARTAVGVSAALSNSPGYLYMLTIDGLETSTPAWDYYGATIYDAAILMELAGATDAINLDGGGSTTMARIDTAGVTLINTPFGDDKTPRDLRPVGNCFAVVVGA